MPALQTFEMKLEKISIEISKVSMMKTWLIYLGSLNSYVKEKTAYIFKKIPVNIYKLVTLMLHHKNLEGVLENNLEIETAINNRCIKQ